MRRLLPGLLLGVGLAATLDQVVLHLMLQWHHLYDEGGLRAALASDGAFHVFGALVLGAGWSTLLRRRAEERPGRAEMAGAVLVGLGGFELFDSLVQHKLLDLHQVRTGAEDLLPYDLVYTGLGAALLALGVLVLRRAQASARRASAAARSPERTAPSM